MTTKQTPFRLIVDLDSTIFKYSDPFLGRLAERLNVEVSTLAPITSYEMGTHGWPGIDSTESYLAIHNEFVRAGMFKDFEAYPHAAEVISRLRQRGVIIKVVTTRFCSADFNDKIQVIQDTAESLRKNGIEFDEFMISNRKEEIAADLAIDDSPSNAYKFHEVGVPVILPPEPYTAEVAEITGFPIMRDWLHAEELVLEALERHEAAQNAGTVKVAA